jgi:2-(1,2-epoxy-1,2-dihydrophenyl)acetyl-CoA isomerase|tara:strand:- start:4262 stop:5077 length:816 start_codon:yes stop_codon:yes gene_type:complete
MTTFAIDFDTTSLAETQFTFADGVATLTLHKPDLRNAISTVMLAELIYLLECCERDDSVRVVVLQGAGSGFCPGDNLRGMGPLPDDFQFMPTSPVTHAGIQQRLRGMSKPTIAALHGFALGVGLDLAMACDFRIVTVNVRLQDQRVIDRGMHAVTGCAWLQTRAIGSARALEFLILGEAIDGETAKAWGMVSKVATEDEFSQTLIALTQRLAKAPTKAIGLMKRQIYAGETMSHEDFMAFAAPLITQIEIKDRQEGIQAFLEKRPANFSGT